MNKLLFIIYFIKFTIFSNIQNNSISNVLKNIILTIQLKIIFQIVNFVVSFALKQYIQIVIKNPCCNDCSCDPYDYNQYVDDVSVFTEVVGILMLIFSFVSVLPQIVKFVKNKSTLGISLHMYELAMYNEYLTMLSTLCSMIDKLQADFSKSWSNFLSPMQQGAIWICYLTNYTQYLYYENKEIKYTLGLLKDDTHQYNTTKVTLRQHIRNVFIYLAFLLFVLITIPASFLPGLFEGLCNTSYTGYITSLNIIAAILGCFEWLPQIYKTYKIKSCGTFSILAMAIQTPGVCINLFVLIGTKTTWNVWVSTIVSATLHVILLCQLCYYYFWYQGGEYKKNKLQKEQLKQESTEQQKLIQ